VAYRAIVVRVLRMLPVAALLALALQPGGFPALRPVSPVVAASGGCSPASSTCYLFDVFLGRGPGVGTGFGTYRTMGLDGTYTGRINCHYGNETQTGSAAGATRRPPLATPSTSSTTSRRIPEARPAIRSSALEPTT
jgi:hypothetical protein